MAVLGGRSAEAVEWGTGGVKFLLRPKELPVILQQVKDEKKTHVQGLPDLVAFDDEDGLLWQLGFSTRFQDRRQRPLSTPARQGSTRYRHAPHAFSIAKGVPARVLPEIAATPKR